MTVLTVEQWEATQMLSRGVALSDFEHALLNLLIAADYQNTQIIMRHWGNTIADLSENYRLLKRRDDE